jgi:hypothetical protein
MPKITWSFSGAMLIFLVESCYYQTYKIRAKGTDSVSFQIRPRRQGYAGRNSNGRGVTERAGATHCLLCCVVVQVPVLPSKAVSCRTASRNHSTLCSLYDKRWESLIKLLMKDCAGARRVWQKYYVINLVARVPHKVASNCAESTSETGSNPKQESRSNYLVNHDKNSIEFSALNQMPLSAARGS